MLNVLDLVFEYQHLLHKEQTLEIELDESERARLVGLERLLRGQYLGRAEPSKGTRLLEPVPVQFTIPGGFCAGELRNVSAGGVAIVTDRAPEIGTRTILRVGDATHFEYVFPGRVVWSNGRVLGVAFDGMPTRTLFTADDSGAWKSNVLLGASRPATLVA